MTPWYRLRHVVRAAALGAAVIVAMTPTRAGAAGLCPGEFVTSQVHEWPAGVSFHVPLRETNPVNGARIKAFRSGLQKSGLKLDADGRATLQVVFTLRPSRTAAPGGSEEGIYNDMNWSRRATPAATLSDPSLPGAQLNLTVIVSDRTAYQQIWVASMQCSIQTPDTEALAGEIGERLGAVVAAAMRRR